MNEREFLFILGSARPGGNTEHLARVAAQRLPTQVGQTWLSLIDHPLPLFEDIRHDDSRQYSIETDIEQTLLDATLAATDVVIASPVYWYSVSASTKLYLDHWSGWMRLPGVEFRQRMASKKLWGISVFSDTDTIGAQPLIETLRLTADYMNMEWGGVLLGYGNRPADVMDHRPSLDEAAAFFESVT